MESNLVDPNYEEYFQDIVDVVNNRECACILCRKDNYIHQTKNDCICGYKKANMAYSI